MELSHLKTFAAVAKHRSFTKAARDLGLSQPAVSYQIKKLERDLGERLFVRIKSGLKLTSQGTIVLGYARKIFDQIENIQGELAGSESDKQALIKLVAITRSLGSPFLAVRDAWRKKRPNFEVTYTAVMTSEAVIDHVRSGDADIGFTTLTQNFDGVRSLLFAEFSMPLVFSLKYPTGKGLPTTLRELENERWLLFEKGSWIRRETDKFFEQIGFRPLDTYETNDGSFLKEMLRADRGISFLPEWAIIDDLRSRKVKAIELEDICTDLKLHLILQENDLPDIVLEFLDFLARLEIEGIRKQASAAPKTAFK